VAGAGTGTVDGPARPLTASATWRSGPRPARVDSRPGGVSGRGRRLRWAPVQVARRLRC